MRNLIPFLLLFWTCLGFGAEVTLVGPSEKIVAISHDKEAWGLNQHACLGAPKDWDPKNTYVPACGWVIMTTHRGAVVKFASAPDDLENGRTISPSATPPSNAIMKAEAARREAEIRHWEEMIPFYQLLLGGSTDGIGSAAAEFEWFSF